MRFPPECYQIHQTLRQSMPHLSEAQTKGFALWSATAQSGCQTAVAAELSFMRGFSAARQRRRQPGRGRSGAEKKSPSALRSPPKAAPEAQAYRGRISPWLGGAEPPSG